jgi:hypothetical protein
LVKKWKNTEQKTQNTNKAQIPIFKIWRISNRFRIFVFCTQFGFCGFGDYLEIGNSLEIRY